MLEDHVPHLLMLNELPIKKLLVWGEYDKVLPLSYGRRMNEKLSSATMEVFENSGHIPHYEEPEKFNELVSHFINEH
ncbi:MAG: pimeloyl-ACP methyl ester carboxylesterase [Granulosicoccus sp.]|jgi:pimeloyl-ACP methyl ester carboxylesterase